MRIGVLPLSLHSVDGAFHYEIVFLNALAEIAPRLGHELVCVTIPEQNIAALSAAGGLAYRGLPIRMLRDRVPVQAAPEAYLKAPPQARSYDLDAVNVPYDPVNGPLFRKAGIDVVLQLGPYVESLSLHLPILMPIYDLNHRLQPQFPEVSALGEFNRREHLYRSICRYSTFILVDSDKGREDVLRFYGDLIDGDRIRILPYYPPIERAAPSGHDEIVRVMAKYQLPKRYFFYPAQFWQHKNHALIVRAVRLIADQTGEMIPVILCGTYNDYFRAKNFLEVGQLVGELNLAATVRYIGAVPDTDLPALYAGSVGLVMPSFFGPTNIPPLEAWHYSRPVIAADIPGIREQIGDAGLLIDPRSPESLARAMRDLWTDPARGKALADRGRMRLNAYDWGAFTGALTRLLEEACERVAQGRSPVFPAAAAP